MTTQEQTSKAASQPIFNVYSVSEAAEGKKARWIRLGAVFAHEDGQGGQLVLDALPIAFDGRLVLRTPKAE